MILHLVPFLLFLFQSVHANDFEQDEAPEILIPRKNCFCTTFGEDQDLECDPETHVCECKYLDFGRRGKERCYCWAPTWNAGDNIGSVGCDSTKCCKYTKHRELMASSLVRVEGDDDSEELERLVEACGDYEYQVLLHVDSHLRAVATPGEDAVHAGCPFLMTQATFAGDGTSANTGGRKTLFTWRGNMDDSDEDTESPYTDESMYLPIGTFQFSEIIRAYQVADPNSGTSAASTTGRGVVYNVVTNNCGSFLVNLALELGIKIDGKVTSFVARRLLEESGKELGSRIRESISNFSLLPGWRNDNRRLGHKKATNAATDQQLVELLVDAQAAVLY